MSAVCEGALCKYRNQQRVKCSGEQETNSSRMGSTPKVPTNQDASGHPPRHERRMLFISRRLMLHENREFF